MNLRGSSNTVTDVEDLRRQIESALGSVEEIVKNKAVINVATSADDAASAGGGHDDEVVVYVSIKINKNDQRYSNHVNQEPSIQQLAHDPQNVNGVDEAQREGGGGVRRVASLLSGPPGPGGQGETGGRQAGGMARTQVTGQAIRPKRRAKGGAGSSLTAPSTPVRGVLGRSRSVEQGRDQGHAQAKSMEVNRGIESKITVLGLELAGWRWLLPKNKKSEVATISSREGLVTRQEGELQHPGQQELRDSRQTGGEGPAPVLLPRARGQRVSLQRGRHHQGRGRDQGG